MVDPVAVSVQTERPAEEGRLLQSVYYGYLAGSAAARALPEPWVYGSAHTIGTVAARRSKRRPLVERNLARVTGLAPGSPKLSRIVDDAFRSYARYWLETFRLVRETKEFFLERVEGGGKENIDAVLARGAGAIIVVSHLGNYDAAGAWAAAVGYDLVTVAEVLRPRRMFDFFVAHRSKLGMRIHPAQPGATDLLAEEVRNGALVAIVGDRDFRQTGPVVDFFGEPAHLPAGPAIVATKADVPLMVAGVYSRTLEDGSHGWAIDIGEPFELPQGKSDERVIKTTRKIAKELEHYIAREPQEWHAALQRFWVSDREVVDPR